MYVGPAKIRPDSFTPRRFSSIITTTHARHSGTRRSFQSWFAEMIAAMPAEIDTATVRM